MALSGPRLDPKTGKAEALVVLCHGYGADGNDLIALAPILQRALPFAAFAAPNGPQPCPGAGRQWFAITELDPQVMHQGVLAASGELRIFVEGELRRLGLASDRLALVGFSQGTMMALHIGFENPKPAAIVGFSGMLTGAPASNETPVLLVHGDTDTVIPPEALFLTAATLGAYGVRVRWHLSRGLAHGIDEPGIGLAGSFLSLAFAGGLRFSGESAGALG
ncbi:MAG: dienelactone hydrolase family protein [Alphaproteobacteria bacterium]|nr:dienelactone hydrolase family protein [Alphaproteobacteria bacterium]